MINQFNTLHVDKQHQTDRHVECVSQRLPTHNPSALRALGLYRHLLKFVLVLAIS